MAYQMEKYTSVSQMNFKLVNYFIITRPLNVLIGMFSIFIGAFITGTIQPFVKVMIACISGGFIIAAGNAFNDYIDVEIDRLNKPFRPLPANKLKKSEVLSFSIILFVLAIFLSIFINITAILIAMFTATGLLFYCAKLKQTILFGNIAVSLFSALAFIFGGVSVGLKHVVFIPAGFAFFFHLGREIIKDVEDQKADELCSVQTLPNRFGYKTAFLIATIDFGFLIVLTLIPYITGVFGKGYFWIVLIGVDLVVIASLTCMWMQPYPDSLRKISAILKADMIVGLIAIIFGNQV